MFSFSTFCFCETVMRPKGKYIYSYMYHNEIIYIENPCNDLRRVKNNELIFNCKILYAFNIKICFVPNLLFIYISLYLFVLSFN